MDCTNKLFIATFHWDSEVTLTTLFVVGILLLLYFRPPVWSLFGRVALYGVVVLPFFYIATQTPRKLVVEPGAVVVEQLIGRVVIPIETITSVERLQPAEVGRSIRILGSGGLFGYMGHYKGTKMGSYRIYATQKRDLVLIRTDRSIYVVSCSEANRFIEAVQELKQGTL